MTSAIGQWLDPVLWSIGWPRRLACVWLLILWLPAAAYAGSGVRTQLPSGKVKNGLRLELDTRWVDGNGYRPVRLTFSTWPPAPAPADRRLRVDLYPNAFRPQDATQAVTTWIDLPQGSASVSQVVSVPQHHVWSMMSVEVSEDGQRLDDLSESLGTQLVYQDWTEGTPAVLVIDSDAPRRNVSAFVTKGTFQLPDLSGLLAILPDIDQTGFGVVTATPVPDGSPVQVQRPDDAEILTLIRDVSKIDIIAPPDLPTRWIDYTCCDLIVISWDDLQILATQHAETWEAIRRYVSTGPTLCVYDVADAARRDALEQLMQLASDEETPRDAWRLPDITDREEQIGGLNEAYLRYYGDGYGYSSTSSIMQDDSLTIEQTKPSEAVEPFFSLRRAHLGTVVAISTPQFPSQSIDISWVFNTLDERRWRWYQRHGVSMIRRNRDYWDFLIPDVGEAPVIGFLVLISAFVIIIGPTNYWLLWRSRRLYLLLLTVPLGATLFASGLFGYAMIADGLGIRVRVRSVTYLDQESGQAASWSRQSYYAGLAPSGGMRFPTTAAVYPIQARPSYPHDNSGALERLQWTDEQVLAGAYLRSRMLTQFLVIHPQPENRKLIVRPAPAHPDRFQVHVENQLPVQLAELYVCDARGDLHFGRSIAPGKQTQLTPLSKSETLAQLREHMAAVRPEYPEGFDPQYHEDTIFFGTDYHWWGIDQHLPDPDTSTSILEQELFSVTSSASNCLEPGYYVALVPHSPWVPVGLESAVEQDSFHVVIGRW